MFNKLTVSAKFLIHLNIFRVFKGRMLKCLLFLIDPINEIIH